MNNSKNNDCSQYQDRKFIVKAIIRTTETWEVLAPDEAKACKMFEEGLLLNTAGYELERISSVEPHPM